MLTGETDDRLGVRLGQRVDPDRQGVQPICRDPGERVGDVICVSDIKGLGREPKCFGNRLDGFPLRRRCRVSHILQKADPRDRRARLLQQLDAFPGQFRCEGAEPGDVAAGVREARHDADVERLGDCRHDDRDHFRHCFGRFGGRRSSRDDQVHRQVNQLGREIEEPLRLPIRGAVLDAQILPFDVPTLAKTAQQRVQVVAVQLGRHRLENAHAVQVAALCARLRAAEHEARNGAGKNVPAP